MEINENIIQHLNNAGFQLPLFSRTVDQSMFDKEYKMVQGDVFNLNDLEKAMNGYDTVHISLSNVNEGLATKSADPYVTSFNQIQR